MKSSAMAGAPSSAFDRAAWFDRSSRRRIEIAGPDRAKFLHNLTTNDVKKLPEGAGHESFVTTPQGKVLAYVTLLAAEAAILARTDPDSIEGLMPHLGKYGVFDDVAIEDVSARTFEYHLAGPNVSEVLGSLGVELPPEGMYRHLGVAIVGVELRVVRESPTGRPGFTLIGPVEQADLIQAALTAASVLGLDEAAFEVLRIEAGTPVSGRDVTTSHLPQEVGRDAVAINFVKGCYLGQETVARLDALGHVNRIFKGLRFDGRVIPPAGTPLNFEGKLVGSVTSSSPAQGRDDSTIGLGYIRVAQATAGTKLVATVEGIGDFEAVVHDLPMLSS